MIGKLVVNLEIDRLRIDVSKDLLCLRTPLHLVRIGKDVVFLHLCSSDHVAYFFFAILSVRLPCASHNLKRIAIS